MRPGEFWEALDAHNEEKNADRRHIGELVRGATLRLWNLQVDRQYRIPLPSKFWMMPWDETQETAELDEIKRLSGLSAEQTQAEVAKFLERVNNGRRISESES